MEVVIQKRLRQFESVQHDVVVLRSGTELMLDNPSMSCVGSKPNPALVSSSESSLLFSLAEEPEDCAAHAEAAAKAA